MNSMAANLLASLHMLVVIFSAAVSFSGGIDVFLALNGRALFLSIFLIAIHSIGAIAYILKLHQRHETGVLFFEVFTLIVGFFFLSVDMSIIQAVIVLIFGWHFLIRRRRLR